MLIGACVALVLLLFAMFRYVGPKLNAGLPAPVKLAIAVTVATAGWLVWRRRYPFLAPCGLGPAVTGEAAGRVQFFGEVTGQVDLPAGRPTQLAEAILSLGKTSESADLRKVKVLRADGTTVVVDVRKVIQENRRDLDLDLRDGDRVEVPKRIL